MPYSSFRQFAAALCDVAGIAVPELTPDSNGLVAFHVVVDEVIVNLAQLDMANNDEAFILVTFGAAPQDQELEVLRVMGDANFTMMSAGSPVMCRDPDSGEVILRKSISLGAVDARSVLDSIVQLAQLARHWRADPTLAQIAERDAVFDPQRFA
ncbi:CesT family type III secretion system chaperone [Caenimonas sp. SL110]|uniref:CesT family type III secretion system chaperone n=1 Tax=Caenimonas sp. SL110 TaxID=1450524 RepID=UPI000653C960|nr:CesT family type III secretion system chaperone [Caenimonas sp. SL110]